MTRRLARLSRRGSVVEGFFRRCVVRGQRDGTIARDHPPRDLARLLLTTVMGLRVLARARPEPALLRGAVRQALSLSTPRSGETVVIDLYYWTTPNGHKVTMFLEEAGLPYRIIGEHLGR